MLSYIGIPIPQDVIDHIWEQIDVRGTDECWPWKLSLDSHGYGFILWGTKGEGRHAVGAHRVAWMATYGDIPDGLVIDHLCRNTLCCNPRHLEPVTTQTNLLRGIGLAASNAKKTVCPKGHSYDQANTYRDKLGRRFCRTCRNARLARIKDAQYWRDYRAKRKAKHL